MNDNEDDDPEEGNPEDMQETNNDDRFTKVDNDVFGIEGYQDGKKEENKEEELGDTLPMGSKNKPKIDLNREVKQFKIILLGEKGVGKSSIIERYVNNKFSSNESLEGNDAVKIKRYDVDKNLTAELSINDTTEVEKLDKFPKTYYKDAHGAILVFNLTDQNSFEKLSYWKEELDSHAPSDLVICYLGNQADKIADRKVKKEDIKKILNEEDKLYYDVSAKNGNNISLAFEQLTMAIIEKQKEEQNNSDKVLRGKEGRKTLDLIQNNEVGNRNSSPSNEYVDQSTFFGSLYFWSVFFLSASFFVDLTVYLCYYQEKNNAYNYDSGTFIIRIITDSLFIAPLLIFIRYALTSSTKNYIVGILIFLPQLVLNLISVIKICTQPFKEKGNAGKDENINKRDLKFRPNEMEDTEMFKILNKDLLDYQQYITEIMRRQNNILQIENRINEIKNIVRSLSQEYEVHEYGSYAFGLNMEWSDIDLVLVKVEQENENNDENILLMQPNNDIQNDNISVANTDSTRESVNIRLLNQNNNNLFMNQINNSNILEYLAHKLSQVNWVLTTKFRENLEVKILKAECCVTIQGEKKRFDIDISLESEKHNGLKCVNLINSYLKEYSVLKPITIALRAILHSANLHLPDKGGLSAYGLILMVVSFIQSQKENFLKNEPDLCGKIFYGFLKHYGILFDFNKYLILTYPANESNSANNDKDSYINMNQYGQEFIILDPLNNTNNVANKSFQFMNLKMAFMIAYMVTKEDCDCGCHFGEAEFENSFPIF